MTNTDRAWEQFGKSDPYHGVLTKGAFKKDQFDGNARAAFFQSGEEYVEWALGVASDSFDASFSPTRVLDFGCGVGRLTLPLARRAKEVVGVDVSPGMLYEARANAYQAGLANVKFVASDDELSEATGVYDLVHAFIVLQHIAPARGQRILARLVNLLTPNGLGIVHMTYANGSGTPVWRRSLTTAYERVPLVHAARNAVRRQPLRTPQMHMHRYDLNSTFKLLQESGCHDIHIRFTEASHYNFPVYGLIIFFRKCALDTQQYS